MTIRLGEVLVKQGLLTPDQVDAILEEQQRCRRPFGELAEALFGLRARDVELAWAHQYARITEHVDPRRESIEPHVVAMIDRRQAWQFRIIPLRRDGSEIMIATIIEHLPRAMRFALRHFGEPCYFVISRADALGEALVTHFPMDGMTPAAVLGDLSTSSDF
ncbi:MAG: hypothetical protein VYC34_01975 [Planctomycetota bacterium]|nr:hypothetical protein [Planctomycetota bacterium]